MPAESSTKLDLPLADDLLAQLQDEAARAGQPPLTIVSDLLAKWLRERKRQRVADDIAAFAAEYGGTPLDLDRDLEAAGVECLLDEVEP